MSVAAINSNIRNPRTRSPFDDINKMSSSSSNSGSYGAFPTQRSYSPMFANDSNSRGGVHVGSGLRASAMTYGPSAADALQSQDQSHQQASYADNLYSQEEHYRQLVHQQNMQPASSQPSQYSTLYASQYSSQQRATNIGNTEPYCATPTTFGAPPSSQFAHFAHDARQPFGESQSYDNASARASDQRYDASRGYSGIPSSFSNYGRSSGTGDFDEGGPSTGVGSSFNTMNQLRYSLPSGDAQSSYSLAPPPMDQQVSSTDSYMSRSSIASQVPMLPQFNLHSGRNMAHKSGNPFSSNAQSSSTNVDYGQSTSGLSQQGQSYGQPSAYDYKGKMAQTSQSNQNAYAQGYDSQAYNFDNPSTSAFDIAPPSLLSQSAVQSTPERDNNYPHHLLGQLLSASVPRKEFSTNTGSSSSTTPLRAGFISPSSAKSHHQMSHYGVRNFNNSPQSHTTPVATSSHIKRKDSTSTLGSSSAKHHVQVPLPPKWPIAQDDTEFSDYLAKARSRAGSTNSFGSGGATGRDPFVVDGPHAIAPIQPFSAHQNPLSGASIVQNRMGPSVHLKDIIANGKPTVEVAFSPSNLPFVELARHGAPSNYGVVRITNVSSPLLRPPLCLSPSLPNLHLSFPNHHYQNTNLPTSFPS